MRENEWRSAAADGLLGMAAADALGVPYEFRSRWEMQADPCTDMVGYGTYNQPEGSWSDDTSMALCAAESLRRGFDPEGAMKRFAAWMTRAEYTAGGVRFDIGMTCRRGIQRFLDGIEPQLCGDYSEYGNGNGGLMRTFPVSLYQSLTGPRGEGEQEAFLEPVHACSRLTHAHERGLICCGIYTMVLDEWLHREQGETMTEVFSRGFERAKAAYTAMGGAFEREMNTPGLFIHPRDLAAYDMDMLPASGYAVHTLHAALFCLLTTDNYRDCALRAVNMGEDTDTTAAVAGALAGVIYGRAGIPREWLEKLKNRALIERIAQGLSAAMLGGEEKAQIDSFTGENGHMALKAAARIELDGVVYDNAQAAYLAQAFAPQERAQFAGLTAHQARRLYKQLTPMAPQEGEREEALYRVLLAKYGQNPAIREKLLSTGEKEIIFDTTGAHDNVMGRCACARCSEKPAGNLAGRTLMRVREALRRQ